MKSPIPDLVKKSRQDLTGYVWHFCRDDKEPQAAISSILTEKNIRAAVDRDTQEKVVCFTEAPLEQIRRQAPELRKSKFPRFSLFGVGFKKAYVFNKGGLPVIYQPRKNLLDKDFPDALKWRHVDLDLREDKAIDYSWMREWRVKGDLSFADACDQAIVVVPEAGEFEGELYDIEEDGDYEDGEMVSFASIKVFWNFVSLNWVSQPLDDSAIEVVMMKGNTHLYPSSLDSR
jgi:hypothetical protein